VNIGLLATKANQRVRRVGLLRFVAELPIRFFGHRPVTDFDVRNGTDTEGVVPLWKFHLPFASARFGSGYRSPAEDRITNALADIPRDATLVDLGSGKGRALIVAARLGFAQVIGVEFVRELAEVSRRNLQTVDVKAAVIVADASEWILPEGPLCVYLYSPFSFEVMRKVADKIKNRRDATWVTYLNPTSAPGCAELFDGIMTRVAERPGLVVWANNLTYGYPSHEHQQGATKELSGR
jgi:SAM-dependent methyltransferase